MTAAVNGSYTVTKSYFYTTGPLEDTVVVTTIPFDQYTYRVVSHPNPDAVGSTFVLSVPREPKTFQVNRTFYNSSVLDPDARIDASVFTHTLGNPSSYPTVSQKNSLLSRYGGYQFGPRDVGPTVGGQTGVSIDVSQEVGASTTLAIGWEKTVKVTAKAGGAESMAGFSVGAEASATLGVSVGTGTSYSGSVGEIDPFDPNFDPDSLYSYGIFAYTQDQHASGQEFQVINYWVE